MVQILTHWLKLIYMPLLAKSYKQQNLLLLAVALLLGLVVFKFNIQRTYREYQRFQEGKSQLLRASSAVEETVGLKEQLNSLQETAIRPYKRENLLEKVTSFCRNNNLLVKSFPEEELYSQGNDSQVVTNRIEVEGGYKDIVKLVYTLEELEKLGNVSSMRVYLAKDRALKKMVLRSNIVFRNLKT